MQNIVLSHVLSQVYANFWIEKLVKVYAVTDFKEKSCIKSI